MTRKKLGYIALGLLTGVLATGGIVVWALFQVPDFYRQAMALDVDPQTRKAIAKKFTQRTIQFVDSVRYADYWTEEFTEQQVNSWLAEELHREYADVVPPEMKDPRVRIEDGWVQVGFRYERPNWDGVVSFKLRPWVPRPNQLALEIAAVRAGLMPIPLDDVLKEISGQFALRGWRVERMQSGENDVLLIHLESNEESYAVLESVAVRDGAVTISGRRRHRDSVVRSSKPRLAVQPGWSEKK